MADSKEKSALEGLEMSDLFEALDKESKESKDGIKGLTKPPGDDEPEDDDEGGGGEGTETEIKEEEEESPEVYPIIDLIHNELGWVPIDEIPEEKRPKNNIGGLVDYLNTVVNTTVDSYKEEISSLAGGKLGELIDHLRNDGKFEDFVGSSNTAYGELKIEEDDESTQKRVISERLKRDGYDQAEIDDTIKEFEDTGLLYSEAKRSLKRLANEDKNKESKYAEQRQNALEAEKQRKEDVMNRVKQSIDSAKDIAGIPLNKKDKDEFYNFLYKEDNKGETPYTKSLKKDPSSVIKMAYILYKGFDFSQVGKSDLHKESVKKVKELLESSGRVSKKSNKATGNDEKDNDLLSGKISFSDLLTLD